MSVMLTISELTWRTCVPRLVDRVLKSREAERAAKAIEQRIADAVFTKSERETSGLAALLAVEAKHQQAPPPAASDQTSVFRAMRNTQQSLAMYEREP